MDTNLSPLCGTSYGANLNAPHLLSTSRIENVLKQLTYGIESREGLIVLTCEPNSGRMAVIRGLLDSLRQQNVAAASISNPGSQTGDLYRQTLKALGATFDSRRDDPLLALKKWLSTRSGAGGTTVLIVDRAEELSLEALEEIRMLLNLETPREKMLQIVLVGGPGLDERLRKPELYRLRQRIAARCATALLAEPEPDHGSEEASEHVEECFVAAAAAGSHSIVSPAAISPIHAAPAIPRFPNLPEAQTPMNTAQVEIEPPSAPLVEEVRRDPISEGAEAPVVEEPALELQTDCVEERRPDPTSKLVEAPAVEGPALALQGERAAELHPGQNSSEIESDNAAAQPVPASAALLAPEASDESLVSTGSGPSSTAGPSSADEHAVMTAQRSRRPAIAAMLRWLQSPMAPVRSLRQWRSQLQSGYRAISNPLERARMMNSVCDWLREPFDPIRWLQQSFRSKLREPEE